MLYWVLDDRQSSAVDNRHYTIDSNVIIIIEQKPENNVLLKQHLQTFLKFKKNPLGGFDGLNFHNNNHNAPI